ncbi:MAG: hypothetical protein HZC10_10635 [Nitrospirae bacterium]|nr:hypothetical protein [Nitrospirota bacterium]
MKKLSIFIIFIFLWLSYQRANAANVTLELQFSNPLTEKTTVIVSGFSRLFPLYSTEVAAQATSATINIIGIAPGQYELHLVTTLEIIDYRFTLNDDGSVIFERSPSLQQNGNTSFITK